MAERQALLWFIILFSVTFYRIVILQDAAEQIDTAAQHRNNPLETLAASRYGDFNPPENRWLNITGFTNDTDFAWDVLNGFHDRGRELSHHALGDNHDAIISGGAAQSTLAIYHNVSSITTGQWKHNMTAYHPPELNMSRFASPRLDGSLPKVFNHNLTASGGTMTLGLEGDEYSPYAVERSAESGHNITIARFVTATIGIEGTIGSSESWKANLYGVHFPENGHILLSTHSEKFSAFALPHLTAHESLFDVLQQVMVKRANDTRFESRLSSRDGGPQPFPKCEMVAYLQQIPVSSNSDQQQSSQAAEIAMGERELRAPDGAGVSIMPAMQFSLVAFSPDCGYLIESQGPPFQSPREHRHLIGVPFEIEQRRARHHVLVWVCMISGQLWLLTKQMKEAHSSAMLNRISFTTAANLMLGDGLSTVLLAGSSIVFPGISVLIMATVCLGFMRVLFGTQMMMEIWAVQASEYDDGAAAAPSDAPNAAPHAGATVTTDPQAPPLPPPANRTIDTGVLPIFLPPQPADRTPSNSREQRRPQSLLASGFHPVGVFFVFLAPLAAEWPSTPRRIYFCTLSALYLSFWLPQIKRNAIRNCRRALRWDFMIGQTLLRFLPIAYLYGYKANVLLVETHYTELLILLAWVWVQCLFLASQAIWSPRWFVKSEWLPPVYDYHTVLCIDEEGSNLPVGASQVDSADAAASTEQLVGHGADRDQIMIFDCAICMQSVDAPIYNRKSASAPSNPPSIIARRAYMLTPCRHIFHTKCLEGWMKVWNRGRLPCPICREELPSM